MSVTGGKRRWVWISDAQSVANGTPSVLAVAETIAASGVGVWLWLRVGLYPLLLSSLVMAFLTMLRSDASVALGRVWFAAYEAQFVYEQDQSDWRNVLAGLAAGMAAGFAAYWLHLAWLQDYSNWALVWRSALVGFLALNFGLAGASAAGANATGLGTACFVGTVAVFFGIAATGSGAISIFAVALMLVAALGAVLLGTRGIGEHKGTGAVAIALLVPGIVLGIFVRAILTRSIATLRHLSAGIVKFPENWSRLVMSVDLATEAELVPGLHENSTLRVQSWMGRYAEGGIFRVSAPLAIVILFAPTYFFRLTLKSTFLIYWPLLFVATAPGAYKSEDGTLHWDDARGRRVVDWIAFVMAAGALFGILWTVYDSGFYASFVAWADPRNLPAHVLLKTVSFKVWELDLWEWFALLASAITVICFIWANAINVRHRGRDRQPGWLALKLFYALNRLKTLFVAATILTSVFAMVWFVHDTCTLPDWMTDLLTRVLGPPGACVGP